MRYFILCIIFYSKIVVAQTIDSVPDSSFEKSYFLIQFNEEKNKYLLTYEWFYQYSDGLNTSSVCLSDGDFYSKKDTFYLKDKFSMFKLKFVKINKDTMIPIKSFYNMLGTKVSFYIRNSINNDCNYTDNYKNKVNTKIYYKYLNAKVKKIESGLYKISNSSVRQDGVELKLFKNHTFEHFDDNFYPIKKPLFKGTWKQKGQYLFLFDISLRSTLIWKISNSNATILNDVFLPSIIATRID